MEEGQGTPSLPREDAGQRPHLCLQAQELPANCDMLTVALWIAVFPRGPSCNSQLRVLSHSSHSLASLNVWMEERRMDTWMDA